MRSEVVGRLMTCRQPALAPQIPIGLQWGECVNANVNLPHWEGWRLIGSYESDVGSWLLHHHGEALLLEVPEGLIVQDVKDALNRLGTTLLYVTASHDHWDHIDQDIWRDPGAGLPGRQVHPPLFRPGRPYAVHRRRTVLAGQGAQAFADRRRHCVPRCGHDRRHRAGYAGIRDRRGADAEQEAEHESFARVPGADRLPRSLHRQRGTSTT